MRVLNLVLEVTANPGFQFVLIALVFLVSLIEGAIVFWMSKGDEAAIGPLATGMSRNRQLVAAVGYLASIAAVIWGVLNLGVMLTLAAFLFAGIVVIIFPGRKPVLHWWPAVPYLGAIKYVIVGLLLDW